MKTHEIIQQLKSCESMCEAGRVALAEARSYLCTFLSNLPREW